MKNYLMKMTVSLCGKWIPREKSSKRFNWIFKKLANIMFPDFVIAPENGWRTAT